MIIPLRDNIILCMYIVSFIVLLEIVFFYSFNNIILNNVGRKIRVCINVHIVYLHTKNFGSSWFHRFNELNLYIHI